MKPKKHAEPGSLEEAMDAMLGKIMSRKEARQLRRRSPDYPTGWTIAKLLIMTLLGGYAAGMFGFLFFGFAADNVRGAMGMWTLVVVVLGIINVVTWYRGTF